MKRPVFGGTCGLGNSIGEWSAIKRTSVPLEMSPNECEQLSMATWFKCFKKKTKTKNLKKREINKSGNRMGR